MEKLRKLNGDRRALYAAMAAVFLIILILTALTPYFVDDYAYMFSFADGSRITSPAQIIPSMARHAHTMNGRLISHGLEQFFLMLPKAVFNICNALVFFWIALFCYRAAGRGRPDSALLFLLFPMCYWLYTPVFGQVTLWQVGSLNYMWSVGFCLFFIRPYLSLYLESEDRFFRPMNSLPMKLLFPVLAFLFGMFSEVSGMVGVLVAAGFLAVRGIETKQWKTWLWLPLATAVAGYILMLRMPAEHMYKGGSLTLHDIISQIPLMTRQLQQFTPLCIAWVIMMFFALQAGVSHKREIVSLAFFLGGIAGVYVLIAAQSASERCLCCPSAFFCIACVTLLPELLDTRIGDACRAAVCALAVVFSIWFVLGVFDIQAVHSRAVTRDRSAAEQIAAGEQEIVLDIIYGATKYSAVNYLKDLDLENPHSWPNSYMARYYGVDLVLGNDPQNEILYID